MITKNNVDKATLEKVVDLAMKAEILFDVYEGSMLDNYIFYNNGKLKIFGHSSKYVVFKEEYLNCWSSTYTVVMTDDEVELKNYESMMEVL